MMTPAEVRLRDALEEVRAAAKALGIDAERVYAEQAPLALRVDAWLWRSSRLLRRASC